MNPNDNNLNSSSNINQGNNAGQVPSVNVPPVNNAQVQAPVTPSVQTPVTPSVQTPVAPSTPSAQAPVTPSAPTQSIIPTPLNLGQTQITDTVATSTPQSTGIPSTLNLETTKEDPNAKLAEVNIPSQVPSASNEEPVVINTKKSKGSNIALIFIIILLVIFVYKIDDIILMYENYMETGSFTPTKVPSDNLTGGFILIGEKNSSVRLDEIKFYNFKKDGDLKISFNYESFEKYSDSVSLDYYIELYNSNKELLYKQLFDTGKEIEKNTTVNYSMSLESDVYQSAFYAFVKKYTDNEKNSTSILTCKHEDKKYRYENKYYFKNNGLVSYDVIKESIKDNNAELEKEFDQINSMISANYSNNKLTYSVDLEKEILGFNPVYKKGVTPTILKNREGLKEWTCE